MSNAIAHRPKGLVLDTVESAHRFAKAVVIADMQPKSFGSGEKAIAACFVAIQAGAELGLSPMASIQNIAVINGKPGIYGPAQLGVVRQSGLLVDCEEGFEGQGESRTAVCVVTRKGASKPRVSRFSVADAKRANLWGKTGPWQQYPDRMLMMRARGFALRDEFSDVLLGCAYTIEELTDGGASMVHEVESMPTTSAPALNADRPAAEAPQAYADELDDETKEREPGEDDE